jgi:glycosyltransferase involved in cell wall biosynthesis
MAASIPWTFGIITPRLPSGAIKRWDPKIRPMPANIKLYGTAAAALKDASWDWVLTHNINDLIDSREIDLPKVFLVHGTLSGRILQDQSTIDRALYIKNLLLLLRTTGSHVVYISELKRKDWGIPGEIIRSAVDTSQYGGYRGNVRGVLQVCHRLKERGAMMGWNIYEETCRDLPNLVLGDNPDLPSSRIASGWEDLKQQLRSHRVYLYTPIYPYEDGYNLALLEAMATGMPIATMPHTTSPVRDGLEGVVGSTPGELREKIITLLNNPEEAIKLGNGARKRAEEEFSISSFQRDWQSLAAKLRNEEDRRVNRRSR